MKARQLTQQQEDLGGVAEAQGNSGVNPRHVGSLNRSVFRKDLVTGLDQPLGQRLVPFQET